MAKRSTYSEYRDRYLLCSMTLVPHVVDVFKQNRIPDSGAAFFDMVAEPVV